MDKMAPGHRSVLQRGMRVSVRASVMVTETDKTHLRPRGGYSSTGSLVVGCNSMPHWPSSTANCARCFAISANSERTVPTTSRPASRAGGPDHSRSGSRGRAMISSRRRSAFVFGGVPSFDPQPVFFVPVLDRQFGIAVEAVVIGTYLQFDPARFVAQQQMRARRRLG